MRFPFPALVGFVSVVSLHAAGDVSITATPPGIFKPLLAALAETNELKSQHDWVLAAMPRLRMRIERNVDTETLLARLAKIGPPETLHPATRLALMTLIGHRGYGISPGDAKLFRSAAKGLPELSGPMEALRLMAIHGFVAGYALSDTEAKDDAENLFKYVESNYEAPWFRGDHDLAIRVLGTLRLATPKKDKGVFTARIAAFYAGIPPERRTAALQYEMGIGLKHEAWAARGTKFASETSAEQFEMFHAKLAEAARLFLEAYRDCPRDTRICNALMGIARVNPDFAGATTDEWYRRCLRAEGGAATARPNFASANMVRWGGALSESLRVYREAVDCTDFDSGLPWQCAAIAESLRYDFQERADELRKMIALDFLKVATGYIRRNNETGCPLIGSDGFPVDFHSIACAYLNEAGLMALAKELPTDNHAYFRGFHAHGYRMVVHGGLNPTGVVLLAEETGARAFLSEAYPSLFSLLADDDARDHFDSVSTHRQKMQVDVDRLSMERHDTLPKVQAIGRKLRALEPLVKTDEAKSALRALLESNAIEARFYAGKVVAVPFQGPLWLRDKGDWYFTGSEAVVAQYGRLPMTHRLRFAGWFPPPYELSVRITDEMPTWRHVGFSCGIGAGARFFGTRTGLGAGWYIPHDKTPSIKLFADQFKIEKNLTLSVRILAHGGSVSVSGSPFVAHGDAGFVPGSLTLGSGKKNGTGYYRYRDVSIRKLTTDELSNQEQALMLAPPAPVSSLPPSPDAVLKPDTP